MSGIPADKCKAPRAFWHAVERLGLPASALLRQARLPATLHLNEHAFVTTAQYFELWRALEDLCPEPALGIRLVEAADTAIHPPSTLAAFHARNYRDGIARIARFKRLCSPEQLHVADEKGECTISSEWLYAKEPTPAVATDVAFAFVVELGRRGTGQHLTPSRVEFRRPDPKSDAHRTYFGCPVRYGAPRDLLVLRSTDLDRPFPGHNPELLEILTPALSAALGELSAQSSICEQVKSVLKRSLAGRSFPTLRASLA
ncbi:AraC family transcriptional regulator [Mesorhizobium abyssinicae]|uniref:AraC family transcriptional regulator n=1 Tax=Mesorhizobium abyssinicae TaxID=1209958 RepID=UPI002A23C5BB|nr:AraC family transcriptional regulator [Mesorhizobium abyssinicae]MDX8433901.1 AraC family transcriptional regulator [Mesorhizobium abyssinicae]